MKRTALIALLMLFAGMAASAQTLDGIVVSDYRSMNTALCTGNVEDCPDHSAALCTAYIEAPDASKGYRLVFKGIYSNRLRRGDYIRIDLSKCKVEEEAVFIDDASCIRIGRRNVPIPVKERTFDTLSEKDIFTLVTIADVERCAPSLISDASGATMPVRLYEIDMEYGKGGTLAAVPVIEDGNLVLRPILDLDINFNSKPTFKDMDFRLDAEIIRGKIETGENNSAKFSCGNRRWYRFDDNDTAFGFNGIILRSNEDAASLDISLGKVSKHAPASWSVLSSADDKTFSPTGTVFESEAGFQTRILLPEGTKAVKILPASTKTLGGDINDDKPCDTFVAFDILKITKR